MSKPDNYKSAPKSILMSDRGVLEKRAKLSENQIDQHILALYWDASEIDNLLSKEKISRDNIEKIFQTVNKCDDHTLGCFDNLNTVKKQTLLHRCIKKATPDAVPTIIENFSILSSRPGSLFDKDYHGNTSLDIAVKRAGDKDPATSESFVKLAGKIAQEMSKHKGFNINEYFDKSNQVLKDKITSAMTQKQDNKGEQKESKYKVADGLEEEGLNSVAVHIKKQPSSSPAPSARASSALSPSSIDQQQE